MLMSVSISNFLHKDLIPYRNLADTLPRLDEQERENFLAFAKMMLAWLPEEKKTARELMDHPFLRQNFSKARDREKE